jgi:glyoxylase-like metal-dependent hydrolase (beta-lactamase superfamily II)
MRALLLPLLAAVLWGGCATSAPAPVEEDRPPPGIGRRDDAATLGPFAAGKLTLTAHKSAEYSATVNSWLVEGPTEVGLVDAQLVMPEAGRVVELLRSKGKRLAWVWITHGHPDHFGGLEAIAAAFPDVPLLARPQTTREAPELLKKYEAPLERFFPGEMTRSLPPLTPYEDAALHVDGEELRIVELEGGEHGSSTALLIAPARAMLIADLVYNRVHPWLNELDVEGVLRHVDALAAMDGVDTFYPGHGEPFGKDYLPAYRSYVTSFLEDTKVAKDAEDLVNITWRKHRDWRTMAGLRFSAAAHIEARGRQ